MEIHRVDIAGAHGRQLVAFARGIGAGEIHAQLVAQHETDHGQGTSSLARTLMRTTMREDGSSM